MVFTGRHILRIAAGFSAVGALAWVFFGGFFSVQSVECRSEAEACPEEVMAELMRLKGNSLLTLNQRHTEEKLLRFDPGIERVEMIIRLPSSVSVTLTQRKAIASITTAGSPVALMVDAHGVVFGSVAVSETTLPLVISDEPLKLSVGSEMREGPLRSAVVLVDALQDQFIPFTEMKVTNSELRVEVNEDIVAVFSHKEEYAGEVTSLQRILSEVTIRSKPVTIDIRHEKPVLSSYE